MCEYEESEKLKNGVLVCESFFGIFRLFIILHEKLTKMYNTPVAGQLARSDLRRGC
jgi:hypothetical protein